MGLSYQDLIKIEAARAVKRMPMDFNEAQNIGCLAILELKRNLNLLAKVENIGYITLVIRGAINNYFYQELRHHGCNDHGDSQKRFAYNPLDSVVEDPETIVHRKLLCEMIREHIFPTLPPGYVNQLLWAISETNLERGWQLHYALAASLSHREVRERMRNLRRRVPVMIEEMRVNRRDRKPLALSFKGKSGPKRNEYAKA